MILSLERKYFNLQIKIPIVLYLATTQANGFANKTIKRFIPGNNSKAKVLSIKYQAFYT